MAQTQGARTRRGQLLPAAILLGTAGYLSQNTFVPAPAGGHGRAFDPVGLEKVAAPSAVAAALAGLGLAIDPAFAADAPGALAHGAPGALEDGFLIPNFERFAFGGLLAATTAAWWRGTVGAGSGANLGGKAPSFWGLCLSSFALAGLLSTRWYETGHFPLSNMYESLMFLAWGVTSVTIYFAVSEEESSASAVQVEQKEPRANLADIATVWSSPLALGIVAFATLTLPKELQKASALVPALQSNWLMMHVSVVMMSYATLMFGSVLCMAVLALSAPKDSPINALREFATPALEGIANNLGNGQQEAVPATSPPMASAMQSTDLEQDAEGAKATPMQVSAASGGSITVEFSSSGAAAATSITEDDKLALTLDDLAYRSLLLGFGFLTVGIISGAVWANEAWGNYWSWDPKETWALICWLVYAAYLHVRLQLGWDTRDSAKIGAFGFFVVWLCYIGVNLLGVGLHSYGFFLK